MTYEETIEHAENLLCWLDHKGVRPVHMAPIMVMATAINILLLQKITGRSDVSDSVKLANDMLRDFVKEGQPACRPKSGTKTAPNRRQQKNKQTSSKITSNH